MMRIKKIIGWLAVVFLLLTLGLFVFSDIKSYCLAKTSKSILFQSFDVSNKNNIAIRNTILKSPFLKKHLIKSPILCAWKINGSTISILKPPTIAIDGVQYGVSYELWTMLYKYGKEDGK